MYTIIDYLNYYKNKSLRENQWNVIDNLIFSVLAYLPLETFSGVKSMPNFCEYAENFRDRQDESNMAPTSFKIFDLVKNTNRYRNLEIYNFENIRTNSAQFGAMTLRTGRETIILFKGTDNSFIGWIENMRTTYEYPTTTQTMAVRYLEENIKFLKDLNVYVVGHSKGGNLAMVAAMEAPDILFNRIKTVYNFDGQGFRKKEFKSSKYERLAKKLYTFVPSKSIVGILMYNRVYRVVGSNSVSRNTEHYPTSWKVFGEFLVDGKLSRGSIILHERSTKGIEDMNYEKTKEAFETLFENIENNIGQKFTENINISFDNIAHMFKSMKNIEPEYQESINNIFETMTGIDLTSRAIPTLNLRKTSMGLRPSINIAMKKNAELNTSKKDD